MRTVVYTEYPSRTQGKGLDREHILSTYKKFTDDIKTAKEEKVSTLADMQKDHRSYEEIAKQRDEYDTKIKDLTTRLDEIMNARKVTLNIGLMTAFAVRDSMLRTPVEGFTPFGSNTLERIKAAGWEKKDKNN